MHIMTSKIEASKYTHAQESYIVFDAPQHARYNHPHFHGVGTFSTLPWCRNCSMLPWLRNLLWSLHPNMLNTTLLTSTLQDLFHTCTMQEPLSQNINVSKYLSQDSIQRRSFSPDFFFIIISKCQMFQNISLKIQFDTNRLVLIFISNVKCLKMSSFFKLSLLGFNLIALIQSKIFKTTLIL